VPRHVSVEGHFGGVADNVGVQTTTLGRTGLAVTPVGLGLAALGRPAYINLGRDRHLILVRSVGC
jgi:hypothetical protein